MAFKLNSYIASRTEKGEVIIQGYPTYTWGIRKIYTHEEMFILCYYDTTEKNIKSSQKYFSAAYDLFELQLFIVAFVGFI